ncbi:hypothetical protein VA7868_02392 [Vibrio aerogenes CECT 7868]|uniref:Chromosome partition protein Smc n=1 Tax=Vibrio aerogenes CECT 7868 TaxID=1216006 RepID=A0A1M5Z794_9VIBR|nr:DUF3450 domain-containing protein [Vibrio aerogenes]SHI20105.1 hypothetical protein VA7868_02392 [Vibrio aerogenes CECT 7868]
MNRLKYRVSLKYSMVCLAALSVFPASAANQLDKANSVQLQTNQTSAKSQKIIDQSSSASMALKTDIDQLNEEIRNLKVYRDHLTALVQDQNQEAQNLNDQISGIKQTRQGIVPLMYQMIDGLKAIISLDKPLKLNQRQMRVADLTQLMKRADVSEAEKYRRILDAYQIELDYGNKMSTYQDEISLPGQQSVEADILYIGRISLIARSPDHQRFWSWDVQSGQWLAGDLSYLTEINQAYSLANQQTAPGLLTIPVSLVTPEVQ